ncbi:MAG TPA: M17 family peptidase N-terminal domain-containing protein [Steroidobacter sp.]
MSTTTEKLQRAPRQFLLKPPTQAKVSVSGSLSPSATAFGVLVSMTGETPKQLGLSRERMAATGFTGEAGSTLTIPGVDGPILVAVGVGGGDEVDAARLRDAAAAFASAAATQDRLAFALAGSSVVPIDVAAQAAVEGMLLARYEYAGFGRELKRRPIKEIQLVVDTAQQAVAKVGADRGLAYANATIVARDLANTPHSHLTATHLATLATQLGKEHGFTVEVFDKPALEKLSCGGLLGVNAGSIEPPCMIKLSYKPKAAATGRIAFVGKGIMYDSGGISLKPNDNVHARMKNDMSGAAAVLAAVAELPDLDCTTAVTAYLMCTDNMPSSTAMALGDIITTHGGKTVEVNNTDAEGRLVMCDALALAAEEKHDAIIDIATLTGSVMRALGTDLAGLFGNDEALIAQVEHAAEATGERVWQMPLHKPYRKALDSDVAAMRNTGPTGGTQPDGIVAALYLAEFVGESPWVHIDICGTAWYDRDELWRRAGCSGFGARLLIELAMNFRASARATTRH